MLSSDLSSSGSEISCGEEDICESVFSSDSFDDNYVNLTDFSGLGLVDGIFLVHFDEPEFNPEKRREVYEKLLQENKYKIYTLTNEDTLVVKK